MLRNNKLEIFESFQIDYNLPKYNSNNKNVILTTSTNNTFFIGNGLVNSDSEPISFWGGSGSQNDPSSFKMQPSSSRKKIWFFTEFLDKLRNKKEAKQKIVDDQKLTVTIVDFFKSLGDHLNPMTDVKDIGVYYDTLINNATSAGQTALVQSLKSRLKVATTESILIGNYLREYLTEQQIIDFYNQTHSDRALKLTWIRNFIKPMPSRVLDLKMELDKKFAFDNYVILHYDPNNDATDLTNEEKEEIIRRKKDPILFGVINGSRRLYYIADWIDEYCNLTLDVVVETLGDDVGQINNESVKTYLDRGFPIESRFPLPKEESEQKINQDSSSGCTYHLPLPENFDANLISENEIEHSKDLEEIQIAVPKKKKVTTKKKAAKKVAKKIVPKKKK